MPDRPPDDTPRWPPPAPPAENAPSRRFRPPQRHARWIDRDRTNEEPREDSPRLLWWILLGLLAFGVFSVMIRMFLAS